MASIRKSGLFLVWLLPVLAVIGTMYRAPAWLEPRTLTVTLEPGQMLTLGREALWAPQADTDHLRLRRAADGGWWLANIAPGKQVLWRPAWGDDDQSIREWPLTAGTVFTIAAQPLTVLAVEADALLLQTAGQRWEYDGIQLRRNGQPLPECYASWRTQVRHGLAALGLNAAVQRPLRLGGGVYCANRLGLTEVPIDTAAIALTQTGFVLRPGRAGRLDDPPVQVAVGTPQMESLWQRSILLARNDRLMIGRTQYQVTQIEPALEFAVLARAQRRLASSPPATHPSAAIAVYWQPLAWLWPSSLHEQIGPLSLVWPGLALALIGSTRRIRWQMALALALAGTSLGVYLHILTVPVLWPYLLAWSALGVWLWTVRTSGSARLLATLTLLLGAGLATLLQLGVGAAESGWLRYGGSSAALAGAFGWLAWAGWCFWGGRTLDEWLTRWSLRLLGGGALVLLLMQAGFGDEGGWGGVQPFELTKLALVTVTAYMLMVAAQGWRRDKSVAQPLLWLHALAPVALLLALSGFALMFLRDFSPLLLLLIWALALAWAYLRVHPQPLWRWGGGVVVIILALAGAAGIAWLHERPDDFPLDFQQNRIRVWAAPEYYPHSGYQLRRALEAIRAGGWWGTIWSDAKNGRGMAIPVVENDFTPAFFLNRYGGVAALVLVGLQARFILLLLGSADRALAWTRRKDERWIGWGGFAYFTLYGGAAMIGAHLVVSWGANLGFLPVMGQPMSLLSSAGSHLVLFVLPLVALAIAVEEKSDDSLS
ncbi:MAG: FtsW/RodA/SpoVE family cell cycle protein [Candidatus Competibacteraceae bacterium]|nr:FtsW/RodA/SpoVE family cell cycle protein [Candidatus Competibacteraceae bacterium]